MIDLGQKALEHQRRLFVGIYTISGAAALVYEVAWTRLLTLQMGHTVAAASTVLAAFMGGLAIGAWLAGRSKRPQFRSLQAYATLEIFVALVALILPAAFRAALPVLSWAYADGNMPARFAFIRVVLSLAMIGLPAAAMGATFPLAAAWFTQVTTHLKSYIPSRPAADAGVLYAANSAGAAVGALAAGFWWIPTLGLRGTTWIGVILNGVTALGALWLSRHDVGITAGAPNQIQEKPKNSKKIFLRGAAAQRSIPPSQLKLAYIAIALSGFMALAYEVAWTRLLELVIGPTTYAFTTMTLSFISGIALGSAIGARLTRRVLHPGTWLAYMLAIIGASASLVAWFVASRLPLIIASQVIRPNATFASVTSKEVLVVVILLLPTTVALGAAFSFAIAVISTGVEAIANDAGFVYAANTLGAITGALTCGFLLLPRLGLHGTFVQIGRIGIISGGAYATVLMLHQAKARLWATAPILASGMLIILVSLPKWDRQILASGAYLYARSIPANELEENLRAGKIEYYRDGAAATVSVRRLAGTLSLAVDGKVDASNGADMLTERLLGLLPALLHGDPRDVGIIGVGSGVTAGSILATGKVRHADVIETSPDVVQASAFFSKENGNVLQAPEVRLIIGDGRSHLLLTRQEYDVLISEPSNPWMDGVSALFTREFFIAARKRLKPNGMFCQWAHTYDIRPKDLQSIVRTFGSVFPQGTMWLVGDGDLLLIGTNGTNIEPQLNGISKYWQSGSVPTTLTDVGLGSSTTPFQLLSLFVGGPSEIARYGSGAQVQTDDGMALEFNAPKGIYHRSLKSNVTILRALADSARLPTTVEDAIRTATAKSWTARGGMALRANAFEMAYDSFRHAVQLDSHDIKALAGASEAAAGIHQLDKEQSWLAGIAAADPMNIEVRVELSHVMAANGDINAAIAVATEAAQLTPSNPRPLEQLASIFSDMGDVNRLESVVNLLVAHFPDREESHYYHATELFLKGEVPAATEEAQRIVSRNPANAKAQNLLGAAYAVAGQQDSASRAFKTSLRLNPRDSSTYMNLGLLYLQSGSPSLAIDYFAESLTLDPTSSQARNGFIQAQAVLKRN